MSTGEGMKDAAGRQSGFLRGPVIPTHSFRYRPSEYPRAFRMLAECVRRLDRRPVSDNLMV